MYQEHVHPMARNCLKRAWRFLVRMDIAAILIVIVWLAAMLGSCFPYLSPAVASDAERWTRWDASVRARYGALTDGLMAGGVFRWFRSLIFLAPLGALTVVTLACALDRWRRAWRRVFHQSVCCPDLVFEAAPYTASLTASLEMPATPASAQSEQIARITREKLERWGYRARYEIAEDTVYLRGDRNRLSPLATLLNHLAAPLLLLGTMLSSQYGWQETLTLGPGATAAVGHSSGLMLRNGQFAIARYSDGNVASYDAQLAVIGNGKEMARRTVRVNEPLTYGGVRVYLQGFQETESGYSVTLLATHDPGYGLVIAAGFLLLIGLVVIFNFPYCCVRVRISPEGVLRLAGEADRQASDFEIEFAALVREYVH